MLELEALHLQSRWGQEEEGPSSQEKEGSSVNVGEKGYCQGLSCICSFTATHLLRIVPESTLGFCDSNIACILGQ